MWKQLAMGMCAWECLEWMIFYLLGVSLSFAHQLIDVLAPTSSLQLRSCGLWRKLGLAAELAMSHSPKSSLACFFLDFNIVTVASHCYFLACKAVASGR